MGRSMVTRAHIQRSQQHERGGKVKSNPRKFNTLYDISSSVLGKPAAVCNVFRRFLQLVNPDFVHQGSHSGKYALRRLLQILQAIIYSQTHFFSLNLKSSIRQFIDVMRSFDLSEHST
jgi:hypothetical protein